jgi:hypothetical protein
MSKQLDNEKTLNEGGFVKDNKRGMWISKERRMAFSGDAVRDQLTAWIRHVIGDAVPDGRFNFYVNLKPELPEVFAATIVKELGLPQLIPNVKVLHPDPH